MKRLALWSAEGELLLAQVELAQSFWQRLKGLLGRESLAPDQGLLLRPCNSVHTLGMRFPIAVVFLDAEHKILRCLPRLAPNRFSPLVRHSQQVLELHPETFLKAKLRVGQCVHFTPEEGSE